MSRFKDLKGEKYGEFTVIEMLHNYKNSGHMYCKCVGDDGGEYIIRQDALRSGATKHTKGACKAGKPMDIVGKKFGKLTPIEPTENRAANSTIVWKCKCDCGNICYVSSGNLKRGHTTSCGCNKRSVMESFIASVLDSNNVLYKTEYTFQDCRNESNTMNLYFDFYLPIQNTIIEYDGILHYQPFKIYGGKEKLSKIQKYDQMKNEYCKKHGINLIRIPYTKTNEEIIQIIDKVIHP